MNQSNLRQIFSIFLLSAPFLMKGQGTATITETSRAYITYPFSSPDPSPPSKTIYPYYRFNVFTDKPVSKDWKVVTMENDFIKLSILPEIGGKIWDAVDKKTGRSFVYNNEVVKFRDIAMRGPWTSGGIEPNYGIIGHTPNCATPVDYLTRTNTDGSVSCFVGTLDLLTQTWWTMEIRLPKDKAYFTTKSFWQNNHEQEQPYYTWMNTGIPAGDDLEFIYPGNNYLGHEGEFSGWPLNLREHKVISNYASNDFGSYKSYHVFGRYANFFGAYWKRTDQGIGRYSYHDEKAGKKIWIWGLSRQGMIWEKLLTDRNGQYVEIQSGRLFNQTGEGSSRTPFKHFGFEPYQTDTWTEYWFPVHGIGGFVYADPKGILNLKRETEKWHIAYQSLGHMDEDIEFVTDDKSKSTRRLNLKPQQIFKDSIAAGKGNLKVYLNGNLLFENPSKDGLSRPLESPGDFDWNSAYGQWMMGKEAERSKNYANAEKFYRSSLEKDRHFIPALSGMANIYLRKGDYPRARVFSMRGLAIDTYDADCNYAFALASAGMGNKADVKDGYDIAALSNSHRTAAYTQLAKWYLNEGFNSEAIHYAHKSLETNALNAEALQVLSVCYRINNDQSNAKQNLEKLIDLNPLNHFAALEKWLTTGELKDKNHFLNLQRNEFPGETFLHYANFYVSLGRYNDALQLLEAAPVQPEIIYWKAWLNYKTGNVAWKDLVKQANEKSIHLVFPFRLQTREVMEWAENQTGHWKPKYYQALIARHLDMPQDAREIILACEEHPNEAPFYSLRAELIPENAELDLKKALTLSENEWIYAKKLFDILITKEKYQEAQSLANQFLKKNPSNSNLIMMMAKSLLLNSNYKECNALLSRSTVLPYEGSTEARQIYWYSWMLSAVNEIQNKKFTEALKSIDQAMLWPEQLGVGKPYETELDLRPEWVLQYIVYKKQNRNTEAESIAKKIKSRQKHETTIGKWSLIILTLFESGKSEALKLLDQWVPADAEKGFRSWGKEIIQSDTPVPSPQTEVFRLASMMLTINGH